MRATFLSVWLAIVCHAGGAPFDLTLGTNRVSQFEKVDLVFDPAQQLFTANAEADLEITTPSGRVIALPAFWFQPFDYKLLANGDRNAEWIYPTGAAGWRGRFAPSEVGVYRVSATVRDTAGVRRSEAVTFECVAGGARGFIRISKSNPQFFEFQNGAPFFALGQNLAFVGESQYLNVDRAASVFRKMGENGANFARIWACAEDWAMAIEARKSAWGRGWNWNPPIVPTPGREGLSPRRRQHSVETVANAEG